jgi:hypothetical protein
LYPARSGGGFHSWDQKARDGHTVGVSSGVSRTAGENVRILPWPLAASASRKSSPRRRARFTGKEDCKQRRSRSGAFYVRLTQASSATDGRRRECGYIPRTEDGP